MNYELAKQLTEAGFPQGEPNGFNGLIPTIEGKTEPVYFPDLSELIEACGDQFIELERTDHKWFAQGGWIEDDCCRQPHKSEEGANPEEAVATLWLALHPKP